MSEKQRASALEALLVYDSMLKARESQNEIINQINDLMARSPINAIDGGKPASAEDLKTVFERLAEDDASRLDGVMVSDIFERIFDIYEL